MLVVVALVFVLGVAQFFLGAKSKFNEVRLSPLESGFEAVKPGVILGAPFFFLAVLFVLFDLELVLLFPGVFHLRLRWVTRAV